MDSALPTEYFPFELMQHFESRVIYVSFHDFFSCRSLSFHSAQPLNTLPTVVDFQVNRSGGITNTQKMKRKNMIAKEKYKRRVWYSRSTHARPPNPPRDMTPFMQKKKNETERRIKSEFIFKFNLAFLSFAFSSSLSFYFLFVYSRMALVCLHIEVAELSENLWEFSIFCVSFDFRSIWDAGQPSISQGWSRTRTIPPCLQPPRSTHSSPPESTATLMNVSIIKAFQFVQKLDDRSFDDEIGRLKVHKRIFHVSRLEHIPKSIFNKWINKTR